MQSSTRGRLIKVLTWGVIVPLAAVLLLANTLVWMTSNQLVYEVSGLTLPIVIMGFGVIFLIHSLKDRQNGSATLLVPQQDEEPGSWGVEPGSSCV